LQSFHDELEKTNPDLWRSLAGADFLKDKPAIDAIAVTEGPGLEPALWVGINFARVLSAIWNIPIVPIDHMEGHIVGSLIDPEALQGVWQALKPLPLPAVALLVSGGHTELVSINPANTEKDGDKGAFHYVILGQTKDDAVGEAFDKTARMLGLPYPGGPHISKLSHEAYEAGIPSPVTLPRPMIHSRDLDFSFSGLKTAVLYAVRDAEKAGIFGDKATPAQNDMFRKGMAYELEQSIADVLDAKLRSAIEKMGARSIIIGGGVSANHFLRQRFEKTAKKYDIPLLLPSLNATGDNALMIAIAGALEEEARLDRKLPAFDGELKAKGTKKLA
jgi:N6-L-threonylcarbamoyladenine synthase